MSMRFHRSVPILSIFYKQSAPTTAPLLALLHRANPSPETNPRFELETNEHPPTHSQLSTILSYLGPNNVSQVIEGVKSVSEAIAEFENDPERFKRPVLVDWDKGRVLAGLGEGEEALKKAQEFVNKV
ncbi:hypothetical protein YB2330_005362 [Saitoella coloradoensis]